jgi:tetratricopeptide (TPR) repeat protein
MKTMDYSITLLKINDTGDQIKNSLDTIRTIEDQIIIADWMLTNTGWSGNAATSYMQCDAEFSLNQEANIEHWQEVTELLDDLSNYADEANTYAKSIETIWTQGNLIQQGFFAMAIEKFINSAKAEVVSLDREMYEAIGLTIDSLKTAYAEQQKRFMVINSLNDSCSYTSVALLSALLQKCYNEIQSIQTSLSKYWDALGTYKKMVDDMEKTIMDAATKIPVSNNS